MQGPRIVSTSELASEAAAAESQSARSVTSVVIAHRLSTIRDADVIYVMDRGAVVEVRKEWQLVMRALFAIIIVLFCRPARTTN